MADSSPTIAPGIDVEREDVSADELRELGVNVESDFPGSTVADFKRYPVLGEHGWSIVVKHMPTLTTVSRKQWDLLGPIKLTSAGLHLT